MPPAGFVLPSSWRELVDTETPIPTEGTGMRHIIVVGIGSGNPEHMTIEGISALNRADVVFVLDKGEKKSDLTKLRRDICERFANGRPLRWVEAESPVRDASNPSYKSGVEDWHRAKAASLATMIREELTETEVGAVLVWGDPSLYDSTLRILEEIGNNGLAFHYEVIPGISSLHALAARHRITLNTIGEPLIITTGRKLAEKYPEDVDTVVVMLDGGAGLSSLAGQDLDIYWGAYLGSEDEILISGHVRDVLDEIMRIREARRTEKGWIMDIYLLRQRR